MEVSEMMPKRPHVANNSGNNEWYTPPQFLEAARGVMGGIDLDPASSDTAQQNVQAGKYFTKEDNGLLFPWSGRVWMNPPYARGLVAEFVSKLCGHFRAGEVSEAVVLVNNATETRWFQELLGASSAVCMLTGRVRFLRDTGELGAPLQGQAVVYMGSRPSVFAAWFEEFGPVVRPFNL